MRPFDPDNLTWKRARSLLALFCIVGCVSVTVVSIPGRAQALTTDADQNSWVARDLEAVRDVAPSRQAEQVETLAFEPWDGTTRGGEVTWLRVRLENPRPDPVSLVLEVPHAGLDEVRFVLPSADGRRTWEAGLSVPIPDRPLEQALPAAPAYLEAGESAWALIRVHDGQPSPVGLSIYTAEAWERHESAGQVMFGLFLGFALFAILWNLGQYAIVRERTYLDYTLYLVTFTLYVTWWLDGAVLYLVPLGPRGFEVGALALIGLTGLAVFRFFRTYLDTKAFMPRADRLLRLARPLPFLALVVWFVVGRSAAPIAAAGSLFLVLLILAGILVAALRTDFRRTRYFALAWGSWAVLSTAYPLGVAGLHSNILIFLHGPRVAFLVEVALLSLALADRLNRLKREREEAIERELRESRHAAKLGETFERYVPKQFLSLMGKESILDVRRGDSVDLELSVLFSDIRGFTTMAEELGAERTFRFIDEYLGIMEPALASRGGFINDIYGDGIMALFDGGADDAVAAALAMLDGLASINERRAEEALEPLAMGIGVHTGPLMLGTIGGEGRLDCTVVGDPANVAARIEGMTALYGATLLISGRTRDALEDQTACCLRRIDRVQAKGKGAVVDIFEVLDADPPPLREQKERAREEYEAALDAYLAGDFEAAAAGFRKCVEIAPLDMASKVLLSRAEQLRSSPPADWPGHTRLLRK